MADAFYLFGGDRGCEAGTICKTRMFWWKSLIAKFSISFKFLFVAMYNACGKYIAVLGNCGDWCQGTVWYRAYFQFPYLILLSITFPFVRSHQEKHTAHRHV